MFMSGSTLRRFAGLLVGSAMLAQAATPAMACADFIRVPLSAIARVEGGYALWRVTDERSGEHCVLALLEAAPSEPKTPTRNPPATEPCTLPGLEGAAKRRDLPDGRGMRIETADGRVVMSFSRRTPEQVPSARGRNQALWTMVENGTPAPKAQMEGVWQLNWRQGNMGGACFLRLTSDERGLRGEVAMPHTCSPARLHWTRWERSQGQLRLQGVRGPQAAFGGDPRTHFELSGGDGLTAALIAGQKVGYCGGVEPPTEVTAPYHYYILDGAQTQ